MSNTERCVLGTRGSPLAMWQAETVKAALLSAHPQLQVDIKVIHTKGDKILDKPLAAIGDKGLFTKELENALYDYSIDIAVHSLKDLPSTLPKGLGLMAVLKRHLPYDSLVSFNNLCLADLPEGSLVGTGSLRRKTQLQQLRPDLKFADLRGNIQTRLAKLDRGDYSAIIMAQAALERMDLGARIAQNFTAKEMLPAVGQGAVAVEGRLEDSEVAKLLAPIIDLETTCCVMAERAYLKELGGGCEKPIAGHAVLKNGVLSLSAFIASVDGATQLQDYSEINLIGLAVPECVAMGKALGERMMSMGARELLEA